MFTTILDGDPRGPGTPLETALSGVAQEARRRGGCEWLRLRELRLHSCTGCFDCWLKTPGRCRLRDDGRRIVAALAASDLVVLAAPMRMGFTSALLRRGTERLIPIALPYIEVTGGECHHPMRYGRGLDLALVLEPGDSTVEELAATEAIYRRMARNTCGRLAWVAQVGADGKAVRRALDAA